MRKLETKSQVEKKKKRNQVILGSILVFLLVSSVAGYSVMRTGQESSSVVEENGIKFYYQNGLWLVQSEDATFAFQNLPSEVSNITVDVNSTLGTYYSSVVYFKNTPQGASEILSNIANFVLRYQEACVEGDSCPNDLPVKNCSDNIFIFDETASENQVFQEGNCVYINGDSIKGADAFLYKILGII